MQKHVFRYSLIVLSIILSSQAFAAGEYNNELVNVDLNQSADGSVKVNIYTDKPYKERVIVNKKPDNKYVILLPETSNGVNYKPDFSGVSSVRNVDVKTQQYSSLPGKGYTKITIDGKTPLNIVPQTFTKRTSGTSTTYTQRQHTASRPSLTTEQVQMTVPQRVLQQQRQTPATTNEFVPSYERQRQANRRQNLYNTVQQATQAPARALSTVTQYTTAPAQQAFSTSQNVVPAYTQPQNTTLSEQNNNSNSTQTQNSQENVYANSNQAVDDTPSGQVNDDISEDELAFFKKIIRFKQKVVRKIKKILSVRISLSSFMTVLQLILLAILVKIIGDLVKKLQNQDGQPQTLTRRLIHDNNESFEQAYPSYSNMDVYNSNREDFEEDGKEGFNITPLSAPTSFTNRPETKQNIYSNGLNDYRHPKTYSANDDFYKPLNEIGEEDRMSIFDENPKDIEKTIFKNPLTQISKQDEDRLFDEVEPAEENTPFANENQTNSSDDFLNYAEDNEENDDNFFIFEDDDDSNFGENSDSEEEYEYEEDDDEDENDDDSEYEYEDEDDEEDASQDEDEVYEDDETAVTVDAEENSEPQKETAPVNPFEHLSVQSKYVIDSNRGFAQVSVDGVNAIIGYVGSKISVIRKFNEMPNGKMQVRLNEQPDPDTMIYIIKIGQYKTLVEVKPQSIRQLLDL